MDTSQDNINNQFKISKTQIAFSILAVLLIVFVQFGKNYHMDYVILSPGTADSVSETIHIEGIKTYEAKGKIRFLTVLVTTNRPVFF